MRNFWRALNKTLKFDLQKDDHDSFGPSRQIAAKNFFLKALWAKQIRFWLMEGILLMNEGILFSAEIRVVGSYTDRLLIANYVPSSSPQGVLSFTQRFFKS